MSNENMRPLVAKAQVKWGNDAQLDMVQEECAELIVIINQYRRGRASVERVVLEVADVAIMLDYMRHSFGDLSVDFAIEKKLERLTKRLEGF